MPNALAAALAFSIPLVLVFALLQGLRSYLSRRRQMLRADAAARARRAQGYYWWGASVVVGLLGVVATIQHFIAGKPAVFGTWVMAGAAFGLVAAGMTGIALLRRGPA